MLPVLGWKIIERQQVVAVPGQFGHGVLVFDAISFDEEVKSRLSFFLRLRHPDVLQICLGLVMQRPGQRSSDVSRLVNPATLFASAGVNIPQGCPEPKGPVADGQFRRGVQSTLLKAAKKVAPTVGVLAKPIPDRQNILLTVFISTDNYQYTLAVSIQTRREVDPIGPEVNVPSRRQIALAPDLELIPPGLLQP